MGNKYKSKYSNLWDETDKKKKEEGKTSSTSTYNSNYASIWEEADKNIFLTSLNDRLNTFTSKENEGKWWDKNRVNEADSIIKGLDMYGKDLDQKSLTEIKNYLTNNKKYYSQWATEEDYNFSINNNKNILKYSQMSTEDLKKEKEEHDKVKKDVTVSKYSKAFAPSGNPQGEAISGLILGLMDKQDPNKTDYDSHKKWEQDYKDKAVLYYDSKGNAVTYDSLIRDKEHEKIFEEINGDTTKLSAYANATEAQKKILELDKKYQELETQKMVYQTNGFVPDAIVAEQQSIIDAVNQQKAIIEDFNSFGYDFDELRYYNRMIEDREADYQKAEEARKYADEHWFKATGKSMVSAPMMIGEYIANLVDTAEYGYANVYDDKYINQNQVYTATVGQKANDWVVDVTGQEWAGKLANDAYVGITSGISSAVVGLVSTALSGGNVAVGTGAAMAIMGTQAAASSYNSKIKSGSTQTEAISFSVASGIGEALFELLPLDNLFRLAKGVGKTATKEGIATLLKGFARQSAIEGLEEGGTELWNAMADAIINGDHSDYNIAVDKYLKQGYSQSDAQKMASIDWLQGLVSSMIGGAIGGGVVGGAVGMPSYAINQGIQNAQYKALGESTIQNQNVEDLVADAQSLITEGEKSALTKLANQVAGVENVDNLNKRQTKKYTRNVGKLVDEVANTKIKSIESAQSEAIKHELESNGVEDVSRATDIVIKKMSGQTLTEAETKVFESVDGNTIIENVKKHEVKSAVDKDNLKRTEDSLKKTGEMVFTPNKSVQHQQMVEESGYTTTEGETTVDATGVEVDSMIIESLDGEDVSLMVRTGEDSEIVLAGELTLNENYAVMIEGLKRIGKKFNLNTSSANKLLALYEAYNGDAFTFYKAMEAGISYGHYNIREYFDNNKFVADIPEAIKEKLYEIGRENAQKTVDDKQALVELEGKAKAESKVTFAEGVQYHKLNKSQKAQVDFAQTIANTFGFDLEVFRSPKDASGRSKGENGSYSASANLMRLDIDAGTLDGKSLILFTQSHELTHYIQKWSPAKYKVFADFLMEKYVKSDVPVQKLIEQKIEQSKISATMDKTGKHHVLTESEAFDEIVANACEDFLADPNIQQTILEIAKIDQSIAQKIKNFIKNLVERLEKAIRGLQGQSLEAGFVRELDLDAIQELKDLWTEALLDARENVLEARKNTPSKEKNTTTNDSDVKMQFRGLNDEGIEVYETSENLKSLSLKKRKELLINAIRNEYVGRTAKFNKNGTVYYATLDTVSARKSLYGDKKSDKKGYKTKINIGADGNYFELVENALYDSSKDEVGKTTNTDIHDDVAQWDYYIKTIISDGRYFKVLINVADKGNNQYVYDVSLKEIKKGETSSSSNATFNQEVTPDNSISNLTENVNTNDEKFQDRDVLQSSLRSLNNEYTQLKKEVEAIHQRPEYLKFLKDTSILEGEELDKVLKDYGEWSREVGLFAKTKRISEIENEQRSIEKKMRDDTALRREEFFKSIENMHEMEKMEYVDKAIERYGITDRVSLASYLMLNGEMLDFSEGQGYRVEDHRAISEILDMPYDYEYSDGLIAFMNMGNIRMQTYGIDISKLPNYEQKSTLRNVISQVMQENDEFTVDFSNANGYTEGSVTYPRGTSSSKILYDIEDYFKTGVVPEYDSGISDFLYQDRNIDTTINESMTMEQAKLMIQKAFVLGGIYDWYDGEYKNGDDWIRNEGASEVALYIEGEYSLMDKYFNDNQAYIDGDIYVEDVLEAYLAGTLVGKQAEKVTRLDVSKGYNVTDNRFYAPKKYNDIKTLWETANAKVTKANKTQVTEARKSFLFAAHNSDVAAELGISASEVNKKLRSWSNYSTKAKDISTRLNNGVAESNQWSGIQNCSILSQMSVTDEDISSMVKEIKGTSSEYQRNYIAKTMLALNTHIDWSELIFDFKRGSVDENRRSVRGLYENSKRTITIGGSSYQNTVAHEMGHALDYKWQRDLFGERAYNSALTNNSTRLDLIEGGEEAQQFYKNFRNFIKSLTDVNVNYSAYTMDAGETFARFVAKFVEWVNVTANSNTFRETDFYGDKFTASQYIEFVKLLQEKSKLDAKRMSEDVQYQDRNYAPTFYSQMGKVIESVKQDKLGASSVVPMLKGKGIKNEEIKWSGIETFLEGKKSVTKQELLEFVAGSMLQIEETELHIGETKWHDGYLKLPNGENYREFVFKIPNSTYTNYAMRGHWGDNAEGIIAHARVQDFIVNGNKMLFVEEIQSDWHNDGYKNGYESDITTDERVKFNKQKKVIDTLIKQLEAINKEKSMLDIDYFRNEKISFEEYADKANILIENREKIERSIKRKEKNISKIENAIPDAPFRNTYHEYVLKRLLRMAAEEGYDSIGWTPADVQSKRWSDEYAEGYRIEYDQDIPKFLNKYGKKWGAKVGTSHVSYGTEVWSMDITDSMKDSVLYEGQALFQDRTYQPSLDDLGLRKENENLKADVENLKEMLKLQSTVTHGKVLAKAKYKDIAKKLLHDFGMKQVKDQDLLNGFVQRLDKYFTSIINSDELTWEFVMEGACDVAKWLDYEMPVERKPKHEYAKEILKDIRGVGVVLDDLQRAEVAYRYGSYNAFRKSLFGSVKLVNKGTSLDSQWQEWASNYPHIFDANITTNDMPIVLTEIINDMKETESVLNEEEQVMKVEWMAEQIYDAYWLMPTVKTLADKHQKEVTLLKSKHREQMETLREKQKARETKTKEYYQEVLQKVREHKDAQLNAYKEQVKEQKINERDRKNRTVMKNRIKGVVKELNSILSRGTKDRNVKIPIQPAVAKALELAEYLFDDEFSNNFILTQADIDPRDEEMEDVKKYRALSKEKEKHMETMLSIIEKAGTESQVAQLKDTISEIERKMGYLEKKLSSLITSEKKKLQEGGVGEAVKALASAYSQLQESEEEYVKGAYNEGVYNFIKGLADNLSGAKVKEMSADQMYDVYTAFKAVLTTVRDANKLFINGKREDVQQMSSAIMMQISSNKKSKTVPYEKLDTLKSKLLSYSWNELKPYYAFQRIGSSTLMKLYEAARQGEDVLGRDYREAIEFAERIKNKYGYDSWDMNKRYDIKLEDGREFTVTLQEIMSIYAYSKRPQAHEHMMFGGFVFNNKKFFKSNEGAVKGLVKPKTYRPTDAEAYRLSVKDLTEISKIISKVNGLKGFVDEMQGYLSTDMASKGNEISRVLYGVDWFNEKNYFPIKSSRDFLAIVNNPSENYSLRNSGMTKTTVPHAKNPLVLEDFMTVWAEHVGKMSTYHSLVIPIDNLNKVLGYKEASTSMKTVLDSVFGKSAKEYLDNFLKDLNGGISSQGAKSPFANMFGKFKKTAVAASSSVVVQQPTAILRAMAEIDGKYFVGASDKLKHKEKWELIKKYAPVAVIKELGGFDIGSGRKLETILTMPSYEGKDKVKGFFTNSTYRNESLDNAFMWGATKADEIGWNIIWSAAEREVKDTGNLKYGTEEFYKKVGERFTEVVHKTQVYDSTFTRSGFQRSKSDLVQMSMSFMGEPTTTFNMLYDAVLQLSRKQISKGKACRIVGATVSSIIMAAVMKSFVYALRDDDEDKSYIEKYLESTTESLVSDLFIPNMLPFVKDVTSILSGWSVERTDFAIFTDIYESFTQLSSDTVSDYRKVEDLIGSIASLFGIPAKNLLRTGREIYNVGKNIFDNNVPYAQGVTDAIYRGLPLTKDKSKTDKLYRATVNGQQQVIDKYEGENIDNSLKKGLRDNDKRIREGVDALLDSDYTKYGSIVDQIVAEGKFTKEVVSGAIQSEANYFGGKIEEGAEALRDSEDKAYKDVVKELRDRYRGIYTQDEIIKMIKNYEFETEEESDEEKSTYKMKYVEDALASGNTQAATEMIEDIVSTKIANGKTEEEARKSVRSSLTSYWKPLYQQAFEDADSYEQNDIRDSLYEMGVYGSYEEIDETLHGWKQNYVLENYKPQYIQAYQNGDTAEMRRIESKVYSLGVYKNAYKTVRGWVD